MADEAFATGTAFADWRAGLGLKAVLEDGGTVPESGLETAAEDACWRDGVAVPPPAAGAPTAPPANLRVGSRRVTYRKRGRGQTWKNISRQTMSDVLIIYPHHPLRMKTRLAWGVWAA